MEKRCARRGIQALFVTSLASAALIAGCGDDESFSPVAKNRGYDYAFVKTNEFAEYPCNEMREGREAVVGRDKDRYECIFDERDSVYLWAGESDTLTAKGGEFVRAESSNSEEESSDSEDSSSDSEGSSSSRYSSSSSRYSSSIRGTVPLATPAVLATVLPAIILIPPGLLVKTISAWSLSPLP